jgi:hypothetical protein
MPVVKVKGGWKAYSGSKKIHKTKKGATEQLQAIKANQSKKKGK